jgi:hypothetical protein
MLADFQKDTARAVQTLMELQQIMGERANRYALFVAAARVDHCAHVAAYHARPFLAGCMVIKGVREKLRALGLTQISAAPVAPQE